MRRPRDNGPRGWEGRGRREAPRGGSGPGGPAGSAGPLPARPLRLPRGPWRQLRGLSPGVGVLRCPGPGACLGAQGDPPSSWPCPLPAPFAFPLGAPRARFPAPGVASSSFFSGRRARPRLPARDTPSLRLSPHVFSVLILGVGVGCPQDPRLWRAALLLWSFGSPPVPRPRSARALAHPPPTSGAHPVMA